MIIAVLNIKGGPGKSATARNLAAYMAEQGQSACILDLNAGQNSAAMWDRTRTVRHKGARPTVRLALLEDDRDVAETIRRAAAETDWLLLDGRPALDSVLITAARCADLVLVPYQLASEDLQATLRTCQTLRAEAPATPLALLNNRYDPRTSRLDAELLPLERRLEALAGDRGRRVPLRMGDRVAVRRAHARGLGVTEFEPHGKAAHEVRALGAWLLAQYPTATENRPWETSPHPS